VFEAQKLVIGVMGGSFYRLVDRRGAGHLPLTENHEETR
jgi:hypothetical protein